MGKRKVTQYSLEFKKSSAKLASESDKSIGQTAKDLGINLSTLHGWVKKYYPKGKATNHLAESPGLADEVKRLRKEVARVTQERDILKKATAYFAKETM